MEYQHELSQRLAKKEAEFTEQWNVRNPGFLTFHCSVNSASFSQHRQQQPLQGSLQGKHHLLQAKLQNHRQR